MIKIGLIKIESIHSQMVFKTCYLSVNSLPNDNFSDCSKLKPFADKIIYVAIKQKFFFAKQKTLWEKEEMLFSGLLFFHQISKGFSRMFTGLYSKGLTHYHKASFFLHVFFLLQNQPQILSFWQTLIYYLQILSILVIL